MNSARTYSAELHAAHDEAWGAELQPLADAMAALDFDAALAACTALSAVLCRRRMTTRPRPSGTRAMQT